MPQYADPRSWAWLFALLAACAVLSWLLADILSSKVVAHYRSGVPVERRGYARRVARVNIAGLLFAALMIVLMAKLDVPIAH